METVVFTISLSDCVTVSLSMWDDYGLLGYT